MATTTKTSSQLNTSLSGEVAAVFAARRQRSLRSDSQATCDDGVQADVVVRDLAADRCRT